MLSVPQSQDNALLIQKINQLHASKDRQLAHSGMAQLLSDAGMNARGPLLYPCSGSDVVHPILLFPEINEFILIDEHPLFSSNSEINLMDLSQLDKISTPASGMDFWGYGYDYTDVLQIFNRLDVSFNSERFQHRVGALLIVRLRTLCEMHLKQITEVTEGVYKIVGHCDQTEKTIYYIQHHLGDESRAYRWLQEQNLQFQTLFVKAFSVSINDQVISRSIFQQIRALYPDNLQQLTVVTETDGVYGFNRTLPHLLNPERPYFSATTNFAYGYSNRIVITNGESLYLDYPEHLLHLQQIQNQYIQEQQEIQCTEKQKAAAALTCFLRLDAHNKFAILIQEGWISVFGKVLSIYISEDKQCTTKFLEQVISEVLQVAKEKGLDELHLKLMPAYTHLKQQELVTRFIERLSQPEGALIVSLSILASVDEVNFKSSFAIPAAQALKTHGKNLAVIRAQVNDKAALAFIDTCSFLQQHGRLTTKLIEPIVSWRDETYHAVAEFCGFVKKSYRAF